MFSGNGGAQTLAQLLDRARIEEPTYRIAKANLEVAQARSRQAQGALLPQVNLSANTNFNRRNYETRNNSVPPTTDRYNSHSGQLNFTQPIWHYASVVAWDQADATLAQARNQLNATEQDLSAKLVVAWLDVIAARDNIAHAQQQVLVSRQLWGVVRRGVEVGISSAPQVEEAKAKYEQALAEEILAEMDRDIKLAALEQIAGNIARFEPPFLRDEAALTKLNADRLAHWIDAVEKSNPNVQAARAAVDAAEQEVKKQRAGHQPTLDLVGSYGNNSQGVGGFPGQSGYDIWQRAIGLQLNIPLYSGGTQSAKVREALAAQDKAKAEVEAARRAAIMTVRQGWAAWNAAQAKARAGLQAATAAKTALAAAQAGIRRELRTEVDLLQAEQQLLAGMRDYRRGRYEQIAAYAKLKATAGELSAADIETIDKLFGAKPEE